MIMRSARLCACDKCLLQEAVGCFFCNHNDGRIDVSANEIGHHRGINDTERYEYTVSVTRQGRLLPPVHALDS